MYPIARVVTSESRDVPIVASFNRSAESEALVLFAASVISLAFPFNTSATWPRRPPSCPSDVKFVTALSAFFNVIFAKERAVSVSGMTDDSTGPLAEDKSHDTWYRIIRPNEKGRKITTPRNIILLARTYKGVKSLII